MKTKSDRVERKRVARKREHLRAAMRIVAADGLDALTMHRLAAEVDCAVATLYEYFASKRALVADLQVGAIEVLSESQARLADDLDAHLHAAGVDDDVAALTQLWAFGAFMRAAAVEFPEEFHLQQLLLSERRPVLGDAETGQVVEVAMALLERAAWAMDVCVRRGVLDDGNAFERVVVWAAAINGVLMAADLPIFEPEPDAPSRFVDDVGEALLTRWGAGDADLQTAEDHVRAFAATATLAPAVSEDTRLGGAGSAPAADTERGGRQ